MQAGPGQDALETTVAVGWVPGYMRALICVRRNGEAADKGWLVMQETRANRNGNAEDGAPAAGTYTLT